MAQNKRQRLQIRVASHPYLAELNKTDRDMKLQSPLQLASTDSSVATTRESGIATSQCCDAYLDQLNQRLEDGGARASSSDISASGESCRSQPALGPSVLADPNADKQLSQRRAVAGQSESRGTSKHGLAGLVLQESLGSGAFGSVFKCTWQRRELALKMYRDAELGVAVAERELKLCEALGYKNPVSLDLPFAGIAEDRQR